MRRNAETWKRLEELFEAAADLPADQQEAFVERETSADPDLGRELRSLLDHDRRAASRIAEAVNVAAQDAAAPTDWTGRRVGPYRIVREIGRGGFGLVFEAIRDDDEYRKTVAVKLAPWWRDLELLHERFRYERQILAGLEHPNIARFLDGGTHNGIPYFAMEYVEGLPITGYARSTGLRLRQRLELFREVCAAVHHAHQSLVVHRDLKPGNILVSRQGVPKLLDFGIAKLLSPFEEAGQNTITGAVWWTPDYASPEQVRGRPVTTRTDVYSLGLVLFELVTGERAQAADTRSPLALDRSICETPIPPASTRAAGALARQLAGDLDTIIAKATQKEPERRYASAGELSDDLERYLEGRPVRARRDSAAYRASKFVRRNWLAVGAAAVAAMGLAAGAIGFGLQARAANRSRAIAERQRLVAEQERDRAEQEHRTADEQREAAHREKIRAESLAGEAQVQRGRARAEAATAKAVNEFLQDDLLGQASAGNQAQGGAKPDPDLKVRTALDRAAARIGGKFQKQPAVEAAIRLTIGRAYTDLGLFPEAQVQLERAVELRRGATGVAPRDTFDALGALANVYWLQGKRAEAERRWAELLTLERRALGENDPETLAIMSNLAQAAWAQGKLDRAAAAYEAVLKVERRVLPPDSHQSETTMANLAVVYTDSGKYALSEPLLNGVVAARMRSLGPEHPLTLTAVNNLAMLYQTEGKYELAAPLFEKNLAVIRRVLGEEHPTTSAAMNNFAKALLLRGNYAAAEPLFARALEVRRRLSGENHPETFKLMDNLAMAYGNEGRSDEAEALYKKVLESQKRVMGESHAQTLATRSYLGQLYERQGRYGEAEALFAELAETRRRLLGAAHADTCRTLASLGESRVQQGRFTDAEQPLREALGAFTASGFDGWDRYYAQVLLGASLLGQKRFEEAEKSLLAGYGALVERRASIPAESRAIVEQTRARIADLYQDWGKPEKAAPWRAKTQAQGR